MIALFGLVSYCSNTVTNPVTGEAQRVQLTAQQEVALGLQARQQMAAQYGGLYPDQGCNSTLSKWGRGWCRNLLLPKGLILPVFPAARS
jgi:predicted Zn-dependent protease